MGKSLTNNSLRSCKYANIKYTIKNGQNLSRNNGPAIIRFNGEIRWYINSMIHRKKGPADFTPVGRLGLSIQFCRKGIIKNSLVER